MLIPHIFPEVQRVILLSSRCWPFKQARQLVRRSGFTGQRSRKNCFASNMIKALAVHHFNVLNWFVRYVKFHKRALWAKTFPDSLYSKKTTFAFESSKQERQLSLPFKYYRPPQKTVDPHSLHRLVYLAVWMHGTNSSSCRQMSKWHNGDKPSPMALFKELCLHKRGGGGMQ